MDWKSATVAYRDQLRHALSVRTQAVQLAELASAGVSPATRAALSRDTSTLERQLVRLERGEFRIAVVGLEKAGKSSFVNAWLECDILPNESARCTFTTTRIHSVRSATEQRLEIRPKTREKWLAHIADLERVAAAPKEDKEAAKRAQNDLASINTNRTSLDRTVADGPRIIKFTSLETIRNELSHYVADEAHAHAVDEALLHTSQLAEADGLVFYDVPGLNSGLAPMPVS